MQRLGRPTPSVFLADPGDDCLESRDVQTIERWLHCPSPRCSPGVASPGVPGVPHLGTGRRCLLRSPPRWNAGLSRKGFAHWATQKHFHSPGKEAAVASRPAGVRFRVLSHVNRQNPTFSEK